MVTQIAPLPYKKIWQSALDVFKIAFSQVWGIALLFGIISSLPNSLLVTHRNIAATFPLTFLAIVVAQVVIGVYFNGVILHRTYALSTDKSITFGNSLSYVWHRLLPLILNSLIISIIVLLGVLVGALLLVVVKLPPVNLFGMALIALPVIFLMVLLFFCMPLIVLDKRGVFSAIKESWCLVWHNWWRTFSIIMPIVFLNLALSYVARWLLVNDLWLLTTAQVLILTVFFPAFYALILVQFNDLKVRKTSTQPIVTA